MGVLCNGVLNRSKLMRNMIRGLLAVMVALSLFTLDSLTAHAGGSILDKIEYPIYQVRTGSNLRDTPSVDGKWLMNVPKGAYVVLMDGKKHGNYYHVRYGDFDGYLYYGSIRLATDAVFSDYTLQFPELYGSEEMAEATKQEMDDEMRELQDVYSDVNNPNFENLEDIEGPKETQVIAMYTRDNALKDMQNLSTIDDDMVSLYTREGARIEALYVAATQIHGVAINRAKIRNMPSVDGEQVAVINPDDEVIVLDSGENGYIHISCGEYEGFIYSRCIDYDTSLLDDAGLSIINTVVVDEFDIASQESKNREQIAAANEAKQREDNAHNASASISQEITSTVTVEPQIIQTKLPSDSEEVEEAEPETSRLQRRTTLRSLPDSNSNNITTLPAGTDVIVLGQAQGGYTMVQYNGMTGYILENTKVDTIDVNKLGGEPVLFTCTAYCSCRICCGSYSPEVRGGVAHTATGTVPEEGRTIAVDPSVIPYGTKVYIDGMGVYTAEDCGGAIKGNHLDIYFGSHEGAKMFGTQRLYVTIIK